MNESNKTGDILKALADFQQECPEIGYDSKGYNYRYSSWASIMRVVKPLMKKHKMGFYQKLEGNNLLTNVFHVPSGQSIESSVEVTRVILSKMNEIQSLGATITYLKRYSLSAMLGIVTDEDTDAGGASEKPPNKKKATAKAKTPISMLDDHGNPTERYLKIKKSIEDGESITLEFLSKHYELSEIDKTILKKIGVTE